SQQQVSHRLPFGLIDPVGTGMFARRWNLEAWVPLEIIMAVTKLVTQYRTRRPKADGRGIKGAELRDAHIKAKAAKAQLDYNGMPLDQWKAALKKDVEARFGPTPDDLVPAGESGW